MSSASKPPSTSGGPSTPTPKHIDLGFKPEDLTGVTVGSVNWTNIDIALPDKPDILFGPVPNPPPPTAPEVVTVAAGDPPEAVYTYPEGNPPQAKAVSIPVAPVVSIPEFNEPVPSFALSGVTANIDWAWESYVSALVAIAESKYDNFVLQWDPEGWAVYRNRAIWKRTNNPMESRGFASVQNSVFDHSMDQLQHMLANKLVLLKNDIDREMEAFHVEQRQKLEAIKRHQLKAQKELELTHAKAVAEGMLKAWELAVETYKAKVVNYKKLIMAYLAQIDYGKMLIAVYQSELDVEKTKISINSALMDNFKREILAQESLINLFNTQMQVAKLSSEAEMKELEIQLADVQKFISQTKSLIAIADQDREKAMIEADKAKLFIVDALEKELLANKDMLEAKLSEAKTRFNVARDVFAKRQAALLDNRTNLEGKASAIEDKLNKRLDHRFVETYTDVVMKEFDFGVKENSAWNQDLLNAMNEEMTESKGKSQNTIQLIRNRLNMMRREISRADMNFNIDQAMIRQESHLENLTNLVLQAAV